MTRSTLRDGRTLEWSEGGDPNGTPVVFFHGCPDTRRASWSGHAAASAVGVRLIAANRPGYGASTPAPPSYERVVADTAELADQLEIDTFRLLGMSIGGTFALACAALLGPRVIATALVATPREATAEGTPEENADRARPEFLAWRATVDPDDPDDASLAERWLASLPPEDRVLVEGPPAEVAGAAREAIGVPDGYVADAGLVFSRWPFRVADIRCPVSLWYGARDGNAPTPHGAWLLGQLPQATLHVLEGLGHLESLMRSWDRVLGDLVDA
jgi:pimeloyl-ACP methyl ester carboxylesterase